MSNREIDEALTLVDAWVDDKRRLHSIPALGVAVVIGDDRDRGARTFLRTYSAQNEPELTAHTPFRIASVSKVFTATAVMQLRERGALNLHEPVRNKLPHFNPPPPLRGEEEITIWHLLTHTAGIPRETGHRYWDDKVFPTQAQLDIAASNVNRIFPPGTCHKYSNFGLALVGDIIETASGRSFAEYVTTEILVPLGLHATTSELDAALAARCAPAYGRRDGDGARRRLPVTDCGALEAAANFTSTLADLAAFLHFQMAPADHPVLSRASRDLMQRTHWVNADWQSGRALGFGVRRLRSWTIVGHQGWVPGYRSELSFLPEHRLGVIVLCSTNDIAPTYFSDQMYSIMEPIAARLRREAEQRGRSPVDTAHDLVGRFANEWGEYLVTIRDGSLLFVTTSDSDPLATALVMEPAGVDTFRLTGSYGNAAIGELARYERTADGRIAAIRIGDSYCYPLTGVTS